MLRKIVASVTIVPVFLLLSLMLMALIPLMTFMAWLLGEEGPLLFAFDLALEPTRMIIDEVY